MGRRFGYAHAEVDPYRPRAFGTCDRCGMLYNQYRLTAEQQWQGPRLTGRDVLVCRTCRDKPQEQLRAVALPADPESIVDPRPDIYVGQDD